MSCEVRYHANCLDGLAAAYACERWWATQTSLAARTVPVRYGEATPDADDAADTTLLVVDFSYDEAETRRLCDVYQDVIIIDHHRTSRETLTRLTADGPINLRTVWGEDAGCELTWATLMREIPCPALLRYVGDRDVWRWALPDSRAVSAWLREQRLDARSFRELVTRFEFADVREDAIARGHMILGYEDELVRRNAERARPGSVDGQPVGIVESGGLVSETGALVAERYGCAAVWFVVYPDDGPPRVAVSLRGDGSVDCAELARRFGGGGHHNASGFSVPLARLTGWLLGGSLEA